MLPRSCPVASWITSLWPIPRCTYYVIPWTTVHMRCLAPSICHIFYASLWFLWGVFVCLLVCFCLWHRIFWQRQCLLLGDWGVPIRVRLGTSHPSLYLQGGAPQHTGLRETVKADPLRKHQVEYKVKVYEGGGGWSLPFPQPGVWRNVPHKCFQKDCSEIRPIWSCLMWKRLFRNPESRWSGLHLVKKVKTL